MNTAEKVDQLMQEWRIEGVGNVDFVVRLANACIGWTYIFGARGSYCTSNYRKQVYDKYPQYTNLIKKCQRLNKGKDTCSGCYWYPGGKTRAYDCRGFTYWLFQQIGITINGAGATSQWNTDANWSEKGLITDMPKDKVCCVFRKDGSKMEHTLFYDGDGHYIHDSGEVKKCDISKYNATHYAIPKGLYDSPEPQPTPIPEGEAIVIGKKVALRKDPSTQGTIIMRIDTGKRVKIEKFPCEWLYVSYKSYKGWMMREFLKEEGSMAIVTGKRVALRQERSTRAKVITRINTNETVKIDTPPKEEWDYVTYDSKTGYMMKEFLKEG